MVHKEAYAENGLVEHRIVLLMIVFAVNAVALWAADPDPRHGCTAFPQIATALSLATRNTLTNAQTTTTAYWASCGWRLYPPTDSLPADYRWEDLLYETLQFHQSRPGEEGREVSASSSPGASSPSEQVQQLASVLLTQGFGQMHGPSRPGPR